MVDARLVTAGFTIDHLRPAKGDVLRAHARVVRAGRTRVVCPCDLSTVEGEGAATLCAMAQGRIAVPAVPPTDQAGQGAGHATPPHPSRTDGPTGITHRIAPNA
ncbi:PaaI family thioesterase [Streptomyces cellulosae]|uniref:PaaI family thioesterase n=1 Tax=Streptomyces cellulosae TaxID=1968 RepID=A0ABW7XTG6_STRCE